jgi:polysaccharide export outer membrane protein
MPLPFDLSDGIKQDLQAKRLAHKISQHALSSLLFAALLIVAAPPLLAQFSGPSLGADTPTTGPLTPTTDPAILYPAERPLRIGVGDSLTVHVFGSTDVAAPERVSLDGSIQVPLIEPVPVIGLTPYEASQVIAARLKTAGMYRDPHVTVQLGADSPNQVVTLSGEMHGVIPIIGRRTLLNVFSVAGGYPPTASHTVVIHRPGVPQPIIVDLGNDPLKSERADIPIFARDSIVVPRVGVVYLLGAFKTQSAIPLQQNSPLTLMQAASLGGGLAFEAKYKDLRLIRTTGFERKVVNIDIMKVMKGKVPDPVLQADDIIFLPSSTLKGALTNGGFGAVTSLAQLALTAYQYSAR